MKRLMIFVLFSVLLGCLAVPNAAHAQWGDDGGGLFSLPISKMLGGTDPDSKAAKAKKEKEEQEEAAAKQKKEQEKSKLDKKLDDAIKKACE